MPPPPQILTPRAYDLRLQFWKGKLTYLLLSEKVFPLHVLHIVDLSGMVVTSNN